MGIANIRKKEDWRICQWLRETTKQSRPWKQPTNSIDQEEIHLGLNPKIASLVYAIDPATLAAIIDTTIRIATGFEMISGILKINQLKGDEIAELWKQIANLVIVE